MNAAPRQSEHHMETLSRLMVRAYSENSRATAPEDLKHLKDDLTYVSGLNAAQLAEFRELADSNHVVVRALTILQNAAVAHPVERSWGDRLAHKWNYSVPGLPELVEIHVQFLGQTGEHAQMAKRVIDRRVRKAMGGRDFHVPAPEERIVISTLQRVYRHFYFRLCDMIDMTLLLQSEPLNFAELKNAADVAGIWPGVATFLCLIQSYIRSYGGNVALPQEVTEAAYSPGDNVRFGNGFLRVSKLTGAGLYGSQLMHAGRHRDVRALLRLPLLPPLAISALVAHSLTGNDKGIW